MEGFVRLDRVRVTKGLGIELFYNGSTNDRVLVANIKVLDRFRKPVIHT